MTLREAFMAELDNRILNLKITTGSKGKKKYNCHRNSKNNSFKK